VFAVGDPEELGLDDPGELGVAAVVGELGEPLELGELAREFGELLGVVEFAGEPEEVFGVEVLFAGEPGEAFGVVVSEGELEEELGVLGVEGELGDLPGAGVLGGLGEDPVEFEDPGELGPAPPLLGPPAPPPLGPAPLTKALTSKLLPAIDLISVFIF
jgi:hypothetical protein